MKALVYTAPETLEIRDVPDPTPQDDEVIVEVDSVGICGSDMHAYLGHDARRPAPLILGHEASGIIRGGLRNGTRVTVNPLVTCGECRACKEGRDNLCPSRQIISMQPREGAFAEEIVIPERNLVIVPENFSLRKAALAEPLACGWHAAKISRKAYAGRTITSALVIGGGAIGFGAALALRAQGIQQITLSEPSSARRAFIQAAEPEMKCTDPQSLTPSDQFDVVIDGVGFAQTRATASAQARPGGVIAHIGLGASEGGLDIRRMTLQEITFIGTYTYTADDFRETATAMFEGRLGALDWTDSRMLSAGSAAFADIRAGRVDAPKILLDPKG